MTVPSITNSSLVTFTFNDGDAAKITSNNNANLDHDSMPGMVASDALLYDNSGVLKVITVEGKITPAPSSRVSSGTSVTTIDEQRKWLELNLNGAQSGVVFNSNYTSSYDGANWVASPVMFGVIEFSEETGDPSALPFRMVLLVGAI